MKASVLILIFLSWSALASQTRTFSCNGIYENSEGLPFPTIHAETNYPELRNGLKRKQYGEDSLFKVKGYLETKNDNEYLNIELISKKSELVLYNDNSRVGQSGENNFNFVFLGLKND